MALTQKVIKSLPDRPGVYWFKCGREILYIGKAASLRDRVRSYFSSAELEVSRGPRLMQMMTLATSVGFQATDSVLEALLLEARLIKKHQPKYNVKAKDDKSFWSAAITEEAWPRVLAIRGKNLQATISKPQAIYGPFPNAGELRAALKVIRKIFPFRDLCLPHQGRPCFNYQLGLCPGVCAGKISAADYQGIIKQIKLLFSGRKKALSRDLRKLMRSAVQKQDFEQAALWRNKISALKHLQDVALIKMEELDVLPGRIEAYDIAHLSGGQAVGVMVVAGDSELKKSDYRKFKVGAAADDLANLGEVLERRLNHQEWSEPDLIVVDGGANQLAAARAVLAAAGRQIPVVAVMKDKHHRPTRILVRPGTHLTVNERRLIFLLNHEAHRFALAFHRHRRRKLPV